MLVCLDLKEVPVHDNFVLINEKEVLLLVFIVYCFFVELWSRYPFERKFSTCLYGLVKFKS